MEKELCMWVALLNYFMLSLLVFLFFAVLLSLQLAIFSMLFLLLVYITVPRCCQQSSSRSWPHAAENILVVTWLFCAQAYNKEMASQTKAHFRASLECLLENEKMMSWCTAW